MLIITIFGRFIGIYTLPSILSLLRRNYRINNKELLIIWYSGLIKGLNIW